MFEKRPLLGWRLLRSWKSFDAYEEICLFVTNLSFYTVSACLRLSVYVGQICLHVYVSVCPYLSVRICPPVCCICLSFCLYLSHLCLSVIVSLYLRVGICMSVSVCLYLYVCFSVCVRLSLSGCLCLSSDKVFLSVFVCICTCLSVCLTLSIIICDLPAWALLVQWPPPHSANYHIYICVCLRQCVYYYLWPPCLSSACAVTISTLSKLSHICLCLSVYVCVLLLSVASLPELCLCSDHLHTQ